MKEKCLKFEVPHSDPEDVVLDSKLLTDRCFELKILSEWSNLTISKNCFDLKFSVLSSKHFKFERCAFLQPSWFDAAHPNQEILTERLILEFKGYWYWFLLFASTDYNYNSVRFI